MIGLWPLLIFFNASSIEYHAARSTSGNSAVRPERGGHSSEKVLLFSDAGSKSPSQRPGDDCLAAGLLVRPKFEEIALNRHTRLFEKLALGRGEEVFAFIGEAFGNRPGAKILLRPEWPARMNEHDFHARRATTK